MAVAAAKGVADRDAGKVDRIEHVTQQRALQTTDVPAQDFIRTRHLTEARAYCNVRCVSKSYSHRLQRYA